MDNLCVNSVAFESFTKSILIIQEIKIYEAKYSFMYFLLLSLNIF